MFEQKKQQQDDIPLVLSFPDSSHSQPTPNQNQVDDRMLLEKIENTVREYNYLLTSQLEDQRRYFEEKINSRISALRTNPDIASLDYCLQDLQQNMRQKQNQLNQITGQLTLQNQKNISLNDKISKASIELELARELCKCMGSDQEKLLERGLQQIKENPEIEKLKNLLKGKQDVIQKLRRENEEIQKDHFS